MYNGIKAMIAREKELAGPSAKPAAADVQAGPNLKSINDLSGYPVFPAGTTSLLSKYLSRDIWNQYHDKVDAKGVSFKQSILSGCQNVDSGIGVYAGSHDSYSTFNGLFDQVIEDYHGHKKSDKHISNMDYTKL